MKRAMLISMTIYALLIGCIDLPTENQESNQGEELRIILTAKAGAVYSITPYSEVKFDKITTEATSDTTEIKTIIQLHRTNSDSVTIVISKDTKRIFGRINNSANAVIKEFILDNGFETRTLKF